MGKERYSWYKGGGLMELRGGDGDSPSRQEHQGQRVWRQESLLMGEGRLKVPDQWPFYSAVGGGVPRAWGAPRARKQTFHLQGTPRCFPDHSYFLSQMSINHSCHSVPWTGAAGGEASPGSQGTDRRRRVEDLGAVVEFAFLVSTFRRFLS